MLINSSLNYQPNFKQVNLVQVSKKAFKNPEDLTQCVLNFQKRLPEGIPAKNISFLEYPSYIWSYFAENKLTSFSKLIAKACDLSVKSPRDENHHSFLVFTGEHVNKVRQATNPEYRLNLFNNYSQEGEEKYSFSKTLALFYGSIKAGEQIDRIVNNIVAEEKIYKFRIQNLDDLDNIVNEMGYTD